MGFIRRSNRLGAEVTREQMEQELIKTSQTSAPPVELIVGDPVVDPPLLDVSPPAELKVIGAPAVRLLERGQFLRRVDDPDAPRRTLIRTGDNGNGIMRGEVGPPDNFVDAALAEVSPVKKFGLLALGAGIALWSWQQSQKKQKRKRRSRRR